MTTKPTATPLARALARRAIIAALAASALLPGAAFASKPAPSPTMPSQIQVPAGHKMYESGHAFGTQNYTCQATATGYGWTLVAPDATLVDKHGRKIMKHYAGPTWEATDGSKVVGARVDGATVDPTAIPWLLLRAASTSAGPHGHDLVRTTYIQRVNTTGGLAPAASTCDASKVGAAQNVPYTADYYFYKAHGSGK